VDRLSHAIDEFPPRGLALARQGFAIAGALSETQKAKAVDFVLDQFRKGGGQFDSSGDLPAEVDLPRTDRVRLTAALSITIGLLTDTEVSAAEFVDVARGKLFDPVNEESTHAIATAIVDQRHGLSESLSRRRLAVSILPHLTEFEVTVDVRIQFDDDKPTESVSVAIVHIDTDSTNQEIWLQLTRLDIENIQRRLTRALDQMTVSEELVKAAVSGRENK
jgi:hypothetical protein